MGSKQFTQISRKGKNSNYFYCTWIIKWLTKILVKPSWWNSEKSVNDGVQDFDKYEIGRDIGLLDKVQTDNLVKELVYRGLVIETKEKSKIYLSNKGRKKVEI